MKLRKIAMVYLAAAVLMLSGMMVANAGGNAWSGDKKKDGYAPWAGAHQTYTLDNRTSWSGSRKIH